KLRHMAGYVMSLASIECNAFLRRTGGICARGNDGSFLKNRMQTSSATVVVLPVADEADVTLGPTDVRIEVSKKSSGPGGQSVNAAHQAIRATHIATGLTVHCTSSQSQFENRIRAVELLRTKLLDQQLSARSEFERTERKEQRGTGDSLERPPIAIKDADKIRTYNFQRDEVTDHRLAKARDPQRWGIIKIGHCTLKCGGPLEASYRRAYLVRFVIGSQRHGAMRKY
ncbi:unnamed protein product, partial [Polarella glacialis]